MLAFFDAHVNPPPPRSPPILVTLAPE
jgi:hypothetical protein